MLGGMTQEDLIRDAFANQAEWCAQLGSPFTARLLAGFGRCLDRSTGCGRKVLDWPGPPDALGDAVPLRLAGALHAMVRRGRLPELAGLYPPNALPSVDLIAEAAMAALDDVDADIMTWLDHPPQTNEVARSAVLYPGLMVVAAETALPISLYELGASAGLNLLLDRYAYCLGDVSLGEAGSPVVLSPNWAGDLPVVSKPQIIDRRGCDRNPLDVTNQSHRERLIAYVWPDQAERLCRVEAAIEVAMQQPPLVDAGDAADWVEDVIDIEPEPGVVRVLFHSIAFQYFPEPAQHRIATRMQTAGQGARAEAPLAWLAFEQFEDQGPRLTLQLWPHGNERILAYADAHVRIVHWSG